MAAGFAGALDLGWNILTRPKRTSKTDEEEDSSSLVAGLALVAIGGAQYALGTMLRLATARGDGNGIPPLAERRCVFASRGVGPSRRSDENRLSNDAEGATSGAGADFSRTGAGASLAIPSKERNTASPRRLCSSSSASFRERASPLLIVTLGGSSLGGGAYVGGVVVVGGATREPSASA